MQGTGIPLDTKFSDSRLTGIYSATVANMEAGTYSDTKIVSEDETVEMDPYTVDTTKDVTFYYDPESGIYYSNASDKEVATNKLVFDSKDTAYKSVYGAVATGEEVTYSIDTGDEVTAVKLVVKGVAKKTLSMKKQRVRKMENRDGLLLQAMTDLENISISLQYTMKLQW